MTILKAAIVICISLCNQEAEQEEIDPCYLQWHREGRGPIYRLETNDCMGDTWPQ